MLLHDLGRTFTGAWIETTPIMISNPDVESHLYGCVNWNQLMQKKLQKCSVAPLRVRELKQNDGGTITAKKNVAPLRVRELKPMEE